MTATTSATINLIAGIAKTLALFLYVIPTFYTTTPNIPSTTSSTPY